MIVSELFQDILQPVGEHAITSANGSPKKRRNQDQPVIGLLNNSKPNVDYFLEGVEQKLQSVENPDDVLVFVKPRSAGPCPDIDQIAERCDFVVNAVADCGSCTAWSIHDSIELEQMGVATVTVVTESFKDVSVSVAAAIGMPNLPICVIPHPLGELTRNNAVKRGSMAFDSLMDRLTKPRAPEASLLTEPAPKAMAVAGTFEEINDQFEALGWSDGLPIVPPTYEAVERFIAAAKRDRDEVIGVIPPMMGLATVEKIAINAVMAGCRPQHLPVVIAAVRAVCDPDFNLLPIQLTTNSVTPMILVSGPMATDLGINGGFNVFGPGNRNNATIGRALRLILTNVGGGTPGKLDKSCHGQPGKFTMCIAENLAESPWTSYHVDQGLSETDSAVTVIGVTGTQDMIHYTRTNTSEIMNTIVHAIPREGYKNLYSGGGPVLIFGPEQAAVLGNEGVTKDQVRRMVFERTKVPVSLFNPDTVSLIRGRRPHCFGADGQTSEIPIADSMEDITVLVAGGAGNHSVFLPTWGDTRSITVRV